MISLYPDTGPVNPVVDVAAERRTNADGRPWLLTNMVASLDGATAINNASGDLGTEADKAQFRALRAVADAIIVGAATIQAEQYRAPQLTEEIRSARIARGQAELPLLVVVTSRVSFDLDLPLFNDESYQPLVATSLRASAQKLEALQKHSDVIVAGEERVDLPELIQQLKLRGHATVLSEGGPTLNNGLISNNLVDEWNLSISPLLLGGPAARAAQGPTVVDTPTNMTLSRLWQGDDMLFGRWVRNQPQSDGEE